MKLKFKYFVILSLLFTLTGCSSVSDRFNILSIIDKTENWIFSENNDGSEQIIKENEDEEISESTIEVVEEAFPDINEIPQEKPEFDQIDENFFNNDKEIDNDINEDGNFTKKMVESNKIEKLTNPIKEKNITAISDIRENISLKLKNYLLSSDPPINTNLSVIIDKKKSKVGTKVAIIQFPDNSIIPDENAEEVLNELAEFKNSKKLKIIGHASKTGGDTIIGKRKNMEISISRAQAIKNMLINKGFKGDRIFTTGKGDLEPLQEAKEYGEAVNRRVEIFFISE